jgi:hypothetical protein
LLNIGYCLLSIGYWLLAVGYWLLSIGNLLAAIHCLLAAHAGADWLQVPPAQLPKQDALLKLIVRARFGAREVPPEWRQELMVVWGGASTMADSRPTPDWG